MKLYFYGFNINKWQIYGNICKNVHTWNIFCIKHQIFEIKHTLSRLWPRLRPYGASQNVITWIGALMEI